MKLRSQRGMITVDFLFAFVLVFGFTMILFALAFSLSIAEVTQYVTYASAHHYAMASSSERLQRESAIAKYQSLLQNPVFLPLFRNGWFEVDLEPEVGDISRVRTEYQPDPNRNLFIGVGTNFTARMLDFRLPFYGSTASDDLSGGGFRTFLASYLGREPNADECLAFTQERWRAIRALPTTGGAAPYTTSTQERGYVAIADDGC